jgi:hypothetical protein
MAVSVFADPFGSMQQGRATDSLIASRDTNTAMNLMQMQQVSEEIARNREYMKRTAAPPPEPGKPQDPSLTKSASDMIYSKIGDIDKKIGVAQGLGMGAKIDQLTKERDAMLSRYALAQQREESAKKRVQDQQKENIAEVSKFASSAANILSGSDSPEDKRQQLEALEQAAKAESPDAYKILSRGQGQIDWGNPRTANDMKAFAQQAISPEKKMELQLHADQEKRQRAKDAEQVRKDDEMIAHMREGDKHRGEPKLAPGMKWGDAEHTYMVPIPVGAPGKDGEPAAIAPKDEAAAWDYLIRGHSPPSRGGAYDRAMDAVGKIAKDNGMSIEQLVSASADVKTKLSAKRSFEVRTQNLTRAENQLQSEIPVMEEAMKKLDLPSIPVFARANIRVLRSIGNPDVTKLDQAAETVFKEFEGIVTGNPGTLNVQDVQAAHENYMQAQTPQQMKAAIEGMRRIISNAKTANDKTRDEIMHGIRSSVNPSGNKGEKKDTISFHDLPASPEIPR